MSAWLVPGPADGDGPGETATATRALGLATGDAVRTGVGIGVLMLRVNVAAAPGTGVASGPSNTEQPPSATATNSAPRTLAQVVAQLLGSARMTQLTKRLGFDLADPFSSDAELTTDFLQRTLASVVQAEAQGDYPTFALRQRPKHVVDRVSQQRLRGFLDRRDRLGVLDQIAKLTILVVANRRRKTYRMSGSATRLHHALSSAFELVAHR